MGQLQAGPLVRGGRGFLGTGDQMCAIPPVDDRLRREEALRLLTGRMLRCQVIFVLVFLVRKTPPVQQVERRSSVAYLMVLNGLFRLCPDEKGGRRLERRNSFHVSFVVGCTRREKREEYCEESCDKFNTSLSSG